MPSEDETWILDNYGDMVKATGRDGKDGTDGTDGKDGADGKDGVNGTDGKDGVDGKDGANGTDGKDGVDGKDGANGTDGKDGADGKDGVNGTDGKDGADGKDGDSFFKNIDSSNEDYVIFVLNTDPETRIQVPKYKTITFNMEGDVLVFQGRNVTREWTFSVSNNVVSVQVHVPDGWKGSVDFVNKKLYVTSPDALNTFAEKEGLLQLVAFDNKGMSTSITKHVEVLTIRLTYRDSRGNIIPDSKNRFPMNNYYFPLGQTHQNGQVMVDAAATNVVKNGIHDTNKNNEALAWLILASAAEPNVILNDYSPSGTEYNRDKDFLKNIEYSLKPDPAHAGHYMPLACNNLDFWWRDIIVEQGADITNPVEIREYIASSKVSVKISGLDKLPTGTDLSKLWFSFGDQGRSCEFKEGEISRVQRDGLPITVPMALDISRVEGNTAYINYFGTFGTLRNTSTASFKIMHGNTPLYSGTFDTGEGILMGSTYDFEIKITSETQISLVIYINGWVYNPIEIEIEL